MNTSDLERLFRALANRKRLDTLRLVAQRELPLHGVAHAIRLSVKSTNKHLQQLYHVGLVEKSRRGNEVYYRATTHPLLSHKLATVIFN